jgi:hypothetical protein
MLPSSQLFIAAILISSLSTVEGLSAQARTAGRKVPAPYMSTSDQAGHDLVKTEQFVVPVGTSVVVSGLEFQGPACSLTFDQERTLTQVFNALEEITENTVNDTDRRRVAEFKKMRFEIRGYSTFADDRNQDEALSEKCATIVMKYLTSQGTPAWRLEAKGMGSKRSPARKTASGTSTYKLAVDFVRTK